MNPIAVRPCNVSEVESAPNIGALMAEYSQESAVAGLGEGTAHWHLYHAMEASGLLHGLAAYDGETLVGFAGVIVMQRPHFHPLIGSLESYFVSHAARRSGAGLALLRAAEELAKNRGAVGLFLQAPVGGRLDRVMEGFAGYQHTHNTYFRSFE